MFWLSTNAPFHSNLPFVFTLYLYIHTAGHFQWSNLGTLLKGTGTPAPAGIQTSNPCDSIHQSWLASLIVATNIDCDWWRPSLFYLQVSWHHNRLMPILSSLIFSRMQQSQDVTVSLCPCPRERHSASNRHGGRTSRWWADNLFFYWRGQVGGGGGFVLALVNLRLADSALKASQKLNTQPSLKLAW